MNPKKSKLFDELILKSWWAILFFLFCFFAYDQAHHRRTKEEEKLRIKLNNILKEKEEAALKQDDLKRQIESQGDAAFIELTLMRRLGLVPEGQIKVYFESKDERK